MHMPVVATFDLAHKDTVEEQTFSYDKFVWQAEKAEEFVQQVLSDESKRAIRDACDLVDVDVDRAVDLFCGCLLDAGQCMRRTVKNKRGRQYSEWFDRE